MNKNIDKLIKQSMATVMLCTSALVADLIEHKSYTNLTIEDIKTLEQKHPAFSTAQESAVAIFEIIEISSRTSRLESTLSYLNENYVELQSINISDDDLGIMTKHYTSIENIIEDLEYKLTLIDKEHKKVISAREKELNIFYLFSDMYRTIVDKRVTDQLGIFEKCNKYNFVTSGKAIRDAYMADLEFIS